MGMSYGNDDGGQAHDGYPKRTSGALAVKDHSKRTSGPMKERSHADSLIDLVVLGEDPIDLMDNAIDQIREDTLEEGRWGGPYPIGSTVKVNTAGTFEKVGGGTVALAKGDVVSVVRCALGETGTAKMVLLSDGQTRAVVPMDNLGESVGWVSEMEMGPKGHEVPGAKGAQLSRSSKSVGAGNALDQKTSQPKGSGSASSSPSKAQGQGEPKDDKSAQSAGSKSAAGLNPGKAVEHHDEVLQALDMMLENCTDSEFRVLTNFRKMFDEAKDFDLLQRVHAMLFSEDEEYSVSDLSSLIEEFGSDDEGNGKDKKKKPNPFAKKKKDGDKKPPEMMGKEEGQTDESGGSKKKMPFPGAAPPFGSKKGKKKEEADASKKKDHQSPQGKPGKNPSAPGLKEDQKKQAKASVTSIFSRLDEDTALNRQ